DYRFVYKVTDVDLSRKVDVKANDEKVSDLLKEVFKKTSVKYNFFGDQVFLSSRKLILPLNLHLSVRDQEMTITGTVTDEQGLPLPGVNVIVKGTSKGTATDLDGEYEITAEQGQTLEFSFLGFETTSQKVGVD